MTAEKNCLNFKTRKLTRLLTRIYDVELAKAGLKTTQFTLLCHVQSYGPANLGDIARHMGLEQSSLSRNLQPLVAAGWIVHTPGKDARHKLLSLSAEGRKKQAEADLYWLEAQTKIIMMLGTDYYNELDSIINNSIVKLQEAD